MCLGRLDCKEEIQRGQERLRDWETGRLRERGEGGGRGGPEEEEEQEEQEQEHEELIDNAREGRSHISDAYHHADRVVLRVEASEPALGHTVEVQEAVLWQGRRGNESGGRRERQKMIEMQSGREAVRTRRRKETYGRRCEGDESERGQREEQCE